MPVLFHLFIRQAQLLHMLLTEMLRRLRKPVYLGRNSIVRRFTAWCSSMLGMLIRRTWVLRRPAAQPQAKIICWQWGGAELQRCDLRWRLCDDRGPKKPRITRTHNQCHRDSLLTLSQPMSLESKKEDTKMTWARCHRFILQVMSIIEILGVAFGKVKEASLPSSFLSKSGFTDNEKIGERETLTDLSPCAEISQNES